MAFPGTYNFNYYRGDTFEFIIRPKDGSGNAFPLNTYLNGATFTIASVRGSGGTRYTALAVVDTVNNTVTCTITPTVGQALDPEITWYYDVEIRDNFTVFTLLTGTISITPDITQAPTATPDPEES
jgi:hypothetical protein